MKKRKSLRLYLSLSSMVPIFVTLLLIAFSANPLVRVQFDRYLAARQENTAQRLASAVAGQFDDAHPGWNLDYLHGYGMYALNEGYIMKIRDSAGDMVWDAENHDMTLCHSIMASMTAQTQQQHPGQRVETVTRTYPLTSLGGNEIGQVEISYVTPDVASQYDLLFLQSLNRILLIACLLGLLGAVFAGFLIARRISAPLHEVTSLTEEIAGGNYAIRLTSRTAIQEVDVLKQSVNLMADRLQADKENARRLTSDVAHELRTPLSNMHSYLEAMEEGVWEPTTERIGACRKEAERITGLVGQLETLHRSETALQASAPESVNLIHLCQSVSDTFSRQMEARDVHCEVVGESLTLPVEKEKLIQVLTNLLGNAVKYSPDHAEITLRVAREEQGASICVEDHGIGIPPADLPHIFERFYRTDLSRSRQTGGAGIGLSIVQAIVQSQGWEIRVQSEEGIGSTFTVLLPGVPA